MNIYDFVSMAPLAMGILSVSVVIATRVIKFHRKGDHARDVIKNFQRTHGHQH